MRRRRGMLAGRRTDPRQRSRKTERADCRRCRSDGRRFRRAACHCRPFVVSAVTDMNFRVHTKGSYGAGTTPWIAMMHFRVRNGGRIGYPLPFPTAVVVPPANDVLPATVAAAAAIDASVGPAL